MLQIPIYIIAVFQLTSTALGQSSLQPLFYPAAGIRSYRSSVFSSSGSISQLNYYTLLYDSSVSFSSIPHLFVGVYDIQWSGNLDFGIFINSITKTDSNIAIRISSTTSVLRLNFVVLDSILYGILQNEFYTGPLLQPTNFNITNHENYQIILLSQYIGSGSPNNQPILTILNYISKQSAKISLQITLGYQIMLMKLKMFKIQTALPPVTDSTYGVVIVVASNTNSTIWANADYYESLYPDQYFIGLQVAFTIKTLGFHVFSISQRKKTNLDAYMSQMMNLVQYCPISAPYFNLTSHLCSSSCGSGEYSDPYEICRRCESICKQCSGYAYNCTQCPLPIYSLVPNSTNQNMDVFTCDCQIGTYEETSPIKICKLCNQTMLHCSRCSTSSYCEVCPLSLIFNNTTKQCECMFGILKIVNSIPRCISKTIRQQCTSTGYVLSVMLPLACGCPDLYLQLLGVCLPI